MKLSLILVVLLLMFSCGNEQLQTLEWEVIPEHKKVNLVITNYCLERDREYIDFYVANHSAKVIDERLLIDFDRDGLVNAYESYVNYGTSPYKQDNNGDGYNDFLIYLSGININQQQYLRKCDDLTQDTDRDGLSDCEEEFLLYSDPQLFDTDGDGIPDELEVRHGLNPSDQNDAFQDLDGDGLTNIEEIRLYTPPTESNTKAINYMKYQYNVSLDTLNEDTGERCYILKINNISLVDIDNGNLIRLNLIEKDETERFMKTYRTVIEYEEVEDQDVVEIDLQTLEEGV